MFPEIPPPGAAAPDYLLKTEGIIYYSRVVGRKRMLSAGGRLAVFSVEYAVSEAVCGKLAWGLRMPERRMYND